MTAARGRRSIDTGVLRVAFDEQGSNLLAGITVGDSHLGPIAWPVAAVEHEQSVPSSGPVVTVETEGPVRTEMLLRRRGADGLAHEVRVAVFAGQPFLRFQHTITNLADPDFVAVRGLPVVVPGPFSGAQLGFDHGVRRFPALAEVHRLTYPDDGPGRVDDATAGGGGWARAISGGLAVTLLSRYPSEEYPQALVVGERELRLDLLAGQDAPVQLGSGAAKTWEWWLAIEPSARASSPGPLAAALRKPLIALPAAERIVETHALPNALAPTAAGASDFLSRLAAGITTYLAASRTERWDDGPPGPCTQRTTEHVRQGFTGALNWGDWNFPGYRDTAEHGCDPWGNLEYDLPQVFGLAFAATANRSFYDALVPAARHYRDVDIIHHWAVHPEWVGLNHPHKPLHFWFGSVHAVDLGHTWVEGLLTHWRLTGEVRSLDAARGIADVLARMVDKAGNPRQLGWPMIALVAAAEATSEKRYLDAARAYADRALRAVRPDPASGDWKMGILADGLSAVDAATGASAYRQWLDAYGAALLAQPARHPDPRYALPIGYLAARRGEPQYRAFVLDTARTMPIGAWGKPLALAGRIGFRLLAPLQEKPTADLP